MTGRCLLVALLCAATVGCAATRRKTTLGERPTVVSVRRTGWLEQTGRNRVAPAGESLAGRAASVLRSRLPEPEEAGPDRTLTVRVDRLQLYRLPSPDRVQYTCRVAVSLHDSLTGRRLREVAERTEHFSGQPRWTLERWGEGLPEKLARRAAGELAGKLFTRVDVHRLTFLSDGSAPVDRGIEQAGQGKLDDAAVSFAVAARNALEFRDVPLYDLGLVREATGKLDEALAAYEQAWRLTGDPRYLAAMGRVGRSKRKRKARPHE